MEWSMMDPLPELNIRLLSIQNLEFVREHMQSIYIKDICILNLTKHGFAFKGKEDSHTMGIGM